MKRFIQGENRSQSTLFPEALDDYVVKHTENEPELLQKLTRETFQKIRRYEVSTSTDKNIFSLFSFVNVVQRDTSLE